MILIHDGETDKITIAERFISAEYGDCVVISAKILDKANLSYLSGLTADYITTGQIDCDMTWKIKKVIFHDPATIVYWVDGTKTVVKRNKKDKKFDKEKGLAMAICKKYFCSYADMKRTVEKFSPEEKKNE